MEFVNYMTLKDLEALARGYVYFRVNDKYFKSYSKARKYRLHLSEKDEPFITFVGYHIFKKWQGFYYKNAFNYPMHRAPKLYITGK